MWNTIPRMESFRVVPGYCTASTRESHSISRSYILLKYAGLLQEHMPYLCIVCPSKLEGIWGQPNIFLKKLQGSLSNIC